MMTEIKIYRAVWFGFDFLDDGWSLQDVVVDIYGSVYRSVALPCIACRSRTRTRPELEKWRTPCMMHVVLDLVSINVGYYLGFHGRVGQRVHLGYIF